MKINKLKVIPIAVSYAVITLWSDTQCSEENKDGQHHPANHNHGLVLREEGDQNQQDFQKEKSEELIRKIMVAVTTRQTIIAPADDPYIRPQGTQEELSTLASSLIKNLTVTFQRKQERNPFAHWELKAAKAEDDWLSNEFVNELLTLDYLKDVDPNLYNVMDPVDVHNNWWDLTLQILESINHQSPSGQVSPFTIVPINFGNVHWATMIIERNFGSLSSPIVYFFDSLGPDKQKLEIIEKIIKDTQIFKTPQIIDLSSTDLIQKDGKTCGTWMLEAVKAIIQARRENLENEKLQDFIHRALIVVDMEAHHNANLVRQGEKGAKDTRKSTLKLKQETKVKKYRRDLIGDDVWLGKEGVEPTLFTAKNKLEVNKIAGKHPNYDNQDHLNKIILNILQSHNGSEHLSLKQLHEMAYQKLFELEEYKKFGSTKYAFSYHTNTKRTYSLNFLHLLVATNESNLVGLVLDKCLPNLINIVDSQSNNILHLATYYGFHQIVDMIVKYAKSHGYLNALINDRNLDGTNPLGMLFLNYDNIGNEHRLPTAKPFIMVPCFEINRYLNNKRGMDVFATEDLKSIGGLNCLHVALKQKYKAIFNLLIQRNSTLQQGNGFPEVNFCYPVMNPVYHMWHPEKFAAQVKTNDGGVSREIWEIYQPILNQCISSFENEDSGDSDEEDTPAWHYKKSLRELGSFIGVNQSNKTVTPTPITITPKIFDTTLLNSPTQIPLTPEKQEQAKKDIENVTLVHFHGVPFMLGQLTTKERREVGKKFIDINREYVTHDLKNSKKNEQLKAIYTRTTTASNGIENHKMLIDADGEKLEELNRINQLLRDMLSRYASLGKNRNQVGFLQVIQEYINNFTSPDLMDFFWNNLQLAVGDISPDIVQYRFPIGSTSKAPDHGTKYGLGCNVETKLRGELPITPGYVNGRPKHRLAGLLYLIITDLTTYRDMENKGHLIDAIQYYKSDQINIDVNIVHQVETAFLGGVDGNHVALVVPLVYLNFADKNKAFYQKLFNLTNADWNKGKALNGSIKQKTNGNNHTKEFKLLMKIYLPFLIKLANRVANLQESNLNYINSFGDLQLYKDNIVRPDGFLFTEVQQTLKNQVSPRTPEGKRKMPSKPRKLYHDVESKPRVAKKLFEEPEDRKGHLDKRRPLSMPEKTIGETKLALPSSLISNTKILPIPSALPKGASQFTTPLTTPVLSSIGLGQSNSTLTQDGNLEQMKLLAQKGNREDQYKLARIYREKARNPGEQQAQAINNAEAVKWYIKAAEQGHVLAQYYLGFMYEQGYGIGQNTAEAVKWYTKAADQGDVPAKEQLQKLNGRK